MGLTGLYNVDDDASEDALESEMPKSIEFQLHGLTGHELANVRGGELIPNVCDIDEMLCIAGAASRAIVSFFLTAPASSYAYGKVGYSN